VTVELLSVVAGIALLGRGADAFVEGSAALAARWRVAPVVIGALVIGLGTSAPELLVSGLAAAEGESDLGVGNVVGSNIANLSLVLGGAALLAPIPVHSRLLRREAPLSALAVGAFALLTIGGLSRVDGALLLVLFGALVAVLLRAAMRDRAEAHLAEEVEEYLARDAGRTTRVLLVLTGAGLAGTVAGAQILVWGARGIADRLDLTGGFVGLTLVAVGTSLPELVTTISAARRGEDELIVGNVLGSNLFNATVVGAAVALLGPGPIVDRKLAIGGVLLMVAVTAFAATLMARGRDVTRAEAILLLVVYAGTLPLLA
jgi:cation:H+ antiporter